MHSKLIAAGALFAVAACGTDTAPVESKNEVPERFADLVIHGGPIYTGVDASPTVEAVTVVENRISGVGAFSGLRDSIGPETKVVDLAGAAMFPGFVDAHAHLIGVGLRELELNLEGVASIADLKRVIEAQTARAPEGAIIFGRGWIETGWPEERMPTRDDLDAVAPANPVILIRADGHALAANSMALEQAGVDVDETTPDPDGGRIARDTEGRPTGILIDRAMDFAAALLAAPTDERKREAYQRASEVYAAYGWTGMHNMSVDPNNVDLIERAAEDETIRIRIYNSLNKSGLELLSTSGPRSAADGKIITRALKLYVDGALGSRGAALTKPYSDRPGTSGLLLIEETEASTIFRQALMRGLQVNTHAIGDRGNKLVLDWYEQAFRDVPIDDRALATPRWRIEHAQILHTDDIPRFAELGVIPSMQPSHAIGDLHFAPARLGPDRLNGAYAWRSLIDAGAVIAGGSDAPVERGDPSIEFYAAIARRDLKGFQGDDWRPEERVSRSEALKMFTAWPAYASFQEDNLGTIEVGKLADFTVFSKDIMKIPEDEIPLAEAVMTFVDGVRIH